MTLQNKLFARMFSCAFFPLRWSGTHFHTILFAGGMVITIGTLIVMQILKKKRENEAPDDEEDEE